MRKVWMCKVLFAAIHLSTVLSAQPNVKRKIGDDMSSLRFSMLGEQGALRLSELKGKPVILDLWATWCAPCIAAMPVMHDLQRRFGDSLQIILVNDQEKRTAVERFVVRRTQIRGSSVTLPIALADSVQARVLLAHVGLPQYYWIDKNGILRYHTGTREVTLENIRSFIRTGSMEIQKISDADPKALWRSELDLGKSGHGSGLRLTESGANSISCVGYSRSDLYRFAYGTLVQTPNIAQSWVRSFPPLRVISEHTDDQAIVTQDLQLYSFNLLAPPGTLAPDMIAMMRTDLDRYFGSKSQLELRTLTYASLTIPDSMRFWGKVAGKSNLKVTDAELYWNNLSVDIFIREWESNIAGGKKLYLPDYPLVNETNYKGKVGDIRLEGVDMKDITALDNALAPYGIRIQLVRKPLEVLIISPVSTRERGD